MIPTYILDDHYLTKVDGPPDAKALDIQATLDAEIRVRLDEDDDARPLSERLHQIIETKRAGELAGISLLEELEELTRQVLDLVQESQRPVVDSIAMEVLSRVGDVTEDEARAVADALIEEARQICFPNWYAHEDVETDLYRALTIRLFQTFKELSLHGEDSDFVNRCIRLLKKVRFVGEAEE